MSKPNMDELKKAAKIILRECGYRVASFVSGELDRVAEYWHDNDQHPEYTVDDTTDDQRAADMLSQAVGELMGEPPEGYTSNVFPHGEGYENNPWTNPNDDDADYE